MCFLCFFFCDKIGRLRGMDFFKSIIMNINIDKIQRRLSCMHVFTFTYWRTAVLEEHTRTTGNEDGLFFCPACLACVLQLLLIFIVQHNIQHFSYDESQSASSAPVPIDTGMGVSDTPIKYSENNCNYTTCVSDSHPIHIPKKWNTSFRFFMLLYI